MPSSRPASSKARAKIRCSRDTPAPVIQCLRPLSTKPPSRRRSARVRIALASLPASGSVMQMAGLSPPSTRAATRRRCASVPKAITAETAPMLLSTTMRAETVQALAISSTTSTASRKDRPWPPKSRGTVMPMNPASARARTTSQGYASSRSIPAARGAATDRAKSRARPWSSRSSAERPNDTLLPPLPIIRTEYRTRPHARPAVPRTASRRGNGTATISGPKPGMRLLSECHASGKVRPAGQQGDNLPDPSPLSERASHRGK